MGCQLPCGAWQDERDFRVFILWVRSRPAISTWPGAEAMQPLEFVRQAPQGPFGGHLGRAAQQELSEAEDRFDAAAACRTLCLRSFAVDAASLHRSWRRRGGFWFLFEADNGKPRSNEEAGNVRGAKEPQFQSSVSRSERAETGTSLKQFPRVPWKIRGGIKRPQCHNNSA
jgi:hypothetical protein